MKKRLFVMNLAMAMAIAMGLSMLPVSAVAPLQSPKSFVVFGDSISTGYGLEGTLYTRVSYSNLIAQKLNLSKGNGYINHAVDGYTSKDILQKAMANASDVAGADLIILTNGGNDVLSKMLMIAVQAAGINTMDLLGAATALTKMPAEEARAKLYSDANNAIIAAALAGYRQNLAELVSFFQTTAPKARVMFLTQYNPLSGVTAFSILDHYAEDILGQLNAIMTEVVTAGGYELVDTHAVMVGRGMVLSNIMSADIHPNASGHTMMAQKVMEALGIDGQSSSTTTSSGTISQEPVVTTTEPTTGGETTTASQGEDTQTPEITSTETDSPKQTEPEKTQPAGAEVSKPNEEESDHQGERSLAVTPLMIGILLLAAGMVCVIVAVVVRKRH